MGIRGSKPKPEGMKRTRNKSQHEWTEVPRVKYEGAPSLPRFVKPKKTITPAPLRPLGVHGLQLWESGHRRQGGQPTDVEALLVLCEQMDERVALRVKVIRDGDWRARTQLRAIDAQVMSGIAKLGVDPLSPGRITEWPVETKRWWAAVSAMPHCTLWDDTDWQYALDTAYLVAAFHCGDLRLASEIRAREKIMGTTADARRDLRIRYIDPVSDREAEDTTTVTALDSYRRMVGA